MDLTSHHPTAYVFPTLKTVDILLCLAELDIELSKQELTEPQRHKEKLRSVFVSLVSRNGSDVSYMKEKVLVMNPCRSSHLIFVYCSHS